MNTHELLADYIFSQNNYLDNTIIRVVGFYPNSTNTAIIVRYNIFKQTEFGLEQVNETMREFEMDMTQMLYYHTWLFNRAINNK